MSATIFVIVGAKGGVGSTALTYELTQALSKRRPVTVVDADFSARRSIAVLFNAIKPLDQARVPEGNLSIAAAAPNITILEMAPNIHASFTLKPPQVEAALQTLNQSGTSILLDAPQPFAAAVRAFIVRATRFILLTEPSLLGATGARAMLAEMSKFGIPLSSVVLVTNQRDAKPELTRSDVERALGIPQLVDIPPKTDRRYAKAIDQLVEYIAAINPINPMELQPSAATPIGDRRFTNMTRRPTGEGGVESDGDARASSSVNAESRDRMKASVHAELAKRIDIANAAGVADQLRMELLRTQVTDIVAELVGESSDLGSAEDIARLRQEIIDEALGFGPLEDLLRDSEVTEIMVNSWRNVYAERRGRLELTNKRFNDDRQLRLVIERMIAPIGRRIDESTPMVDARLADGSRINAIIEPLSLDGPALTIRRFGTDRLTGQALVNHGAIAPQMLDFLRACVEARLNIIISGGTGSGKTTFLNVLSSFLPEGERIVTIEDAAELMLNQRHVVRLEARPPNLEGRGEIRIRDLVRNALRMRPDRIIVGECRGGEALDMLQAMNTGHDGSLTTVHANTPRDCISRIETMVMMAGFDLPIKAIREQISGAVDLVVQTSRMRDGSRKIVSITEVIGMEGDVVTTQEIVRFDQRGLDKEGKVAGDFLYTSVQPSCLERFEEYGVNFDVRSLSELGARNVAW